MPADAFERVRAMGLALPDVEAATKYDEREMVDILDRVHSTRSGPSS
jgi:hypothetical protein